MRLVSIGLAGLMGMFLVSCGSVVTEATLAGRWRLSRLENATHYTGPVSIHFHSGGQADQIRAAGFPKCRTRYSLSRSHLVLESDPNCPSARLDHDVEIQDDQLRILFPNDARAVYSRVNDAVRPPL